MEFGSNGQWRFLIDGVPFRMDGATVEEAEQKLIDTLDAAPELFNARARQLGLGNDDVEALRLGSEGGQGTLGDAAFAAANRGRIDAEGSAGNAINQFWVGMGRQFVNRWRGAKQLTEEMFGTDAAAALIEQEDRDERELFEKLDKAGVGAEDVGELGADIAALLGLSGAGAAAGTAAGIGAATGGVAAGGVIPTAAAGALLGASHVQQDASLTSRLVDAGIGAAGAAVGPLLGKVGSVAGGWLSKLRPGFSIKPTSAPLYLRFLGLGGRQGATANVIEEALQSTATVNPGRQIIGREALNRVQAIIAELPADAASGLKNEAAYGALRAAVQKAVRTTPGGVNVFDGAAFEAGATKFIGQLGNIFTKAEHQNLVGAIGTLAKGLQGLPQEVTERAAARAVVALSAAPAESAAFSKALQMASNPAVRELMMDGLAEIGERTLANGPAAAAGAFMRGTGFHYADETQEKLEEAF